MAERSGIARIGERDGKRIERLQKVESEVVERDEGELTSLLMRECVRLWREVITTLAVFIVSGSEDFVGRTELSVSEAKAPINRLDQSKIDLVIDNLERVDLNDRSAVQGAALEQLMRLDGQLVALIDSGTTGAVEIVLSGGSEPGWTDGRSEVTTWRTRERLLQEGLRALRLLDGVQDRARPVIDSIAAANEEAAAAGRELDSIRAELVQARAEKAQDTLSNQFELLRKREHKTSWALRGLTLVLAAVAIAVAVAIPSGAEWQQVAAHLAVVTLIGGSSAYVARLASSHRATGDWADSVRVQLNTFQDFLGVIDSPDARTRVYEEFGRRVLGPPPAVNGEPAENGTMPLAQLVQLANEIAANRKA